MKVSKEVRDTLERLFEEVYMDDKSTMLERTVVYAVSLVIYSHMEEE